VVLGLEGVEQVAIERRVTVPLVVVIPAYNEQENLGQLFSDLDLHSDLFADALSIVIVDDGSVDLTASMIEAYDGHLPIELLRFEHNQGPGAAFRAGFERALELAPQDAYVITLEADGTGDLAALPRMLAAAARGADVVLADWKMQNVSAHRRFCSAAAGWFVRKALGIDAKTVSSFFRVYRASVLRSAFDRYGDQLIRESGFACKAEILAKLAGLGASIVEEPVALDWSRRNGDSKMPVVKTMLAYWRMAFREHGATKAPEPAGT
jgi:dolichol-phosphate mannosyltransferase